MWPERNSTQIVKTKPLVMFGDKQEEKADKSKVN